MKQVVNLYHLKIPIPTEYKDGTPVAFYYKSIGAIMDDQDSFEVAIARDWFSEQILSHIGWSIDGALTQPIIAKALKLMHRLGIKPSGCIYEGESTDDPNKS